MYGTCYKAKALKGAPFRTNLPFCAIRFGMYGELLLLDRVPCTGLSFKVNGV
jgi:hypothetical protein